MLRLFTYCLVITLLATTLVYAENGNTCPLSSLSKTCNKTVHSVCGLKAAKSHTTKKIPASIKPARGSENKPSSADTFEKFIAPLIETVAPHFYDRIIKKEEKKPSASAMCRSWS